MRLYQVRVDIYEGRATYPLVTHLFTAPTKRDAWAVHDAHRQADAFLRGCEDRGIYRGEAACRATVAEGWVEG